MSVDSNGSTPGETLDYDPDSGRYQACFDASTIAPSMVVISVVESLTDTESTDLDPLYETIDPAALDRLLTGPSTGHYEGDRTVRFTYEGYEIEVNSYGTVAARLLDDGA